MRKARSETIIHYLLVILAGSLLMLFNLGGRTLDGHEALVAVTARTITEESHWLNPEIVEGPLPENTRLHHWLIPVFNGQPRLVKTPLAYWSVAVLLSIGFPLNEFTVRLPSAIAAVLTAVLTLALGRRIMSARAALMGALVLSTSLGLYAWGRSARPEMLLTFWITLMMASFYFGVHASTAVRRHLWLLAAWTFGGLGNLTKELVPFFLFLPVLLYLGWRSSGRERAETDTVRLLLFTVSGMLLGLSAYMLTLAVPFLHWWRYFGPDQKGMYITLSAFMVPPFIWFLLRSRVKRELKPLIPTAVPGIFLMALPCLLWFWYMGLQFPQTSHILSGETVERAIEVKKNSHLISGLFGSYYLLEISMFSNPWFLVVPLCFIVPFLKRFRAEREGLVFLFCWVVGLLLIFGASVGKRAHYILPALPAMGLLSGFVLEDMFFRNKWLSQKWALRYAGFSALLFLAVGIGALLGLLFSLDYLIQAQWGHILIIACVVSTSLLLAAWAARKGKRKASAAALLLSAILGWTAFSPYQHLWDRNRQYHAFSLRAASLVPREARVGSWGFIDQAIIFYFIRDIPDLSLKRSLLTKSLGPQQGESEWRRWVQSKDGPEWMIISQEFEPLIKQYGFIPLLYSEPDISRRTPVVLLKRGDRFF